MWALKKPDLLVAKNDLNEVIAHAQKLKNEDKPVLEDLYTQYDRKGYCTDAELSVIEDVKADNILQQYHKTYGSDVLSFIASDLKKGIDRCPYCGIGGIQHLDHYMDKSTYSALSVCRLNLVPSCGTCNTTKKDMDYAGFVHPYYPDINAGVVFLKCDVTIQNYSMTVNFHADRAALNNAKANQVDAQISNLKLNERYKAACNDYLSSIFGYTKCKTDKGLRSFLAMELQKQRWALKPNDWHCAFLQGLLDCANFDIAFARHYVGLIPAVNGGEGL